MTHPTEPNNWTRLRLAVSLTHAGLWAERLTRAFWPVWTLVFAVLAALMLGLHEQAPPEAIWSVGAIALLALAVLLWRGARRFVLPRRMDALRRIDASQPGRPIRALMDSPAIGGDDPASLALWRAHQARMAAAARAARAVSPDLRLASRDPFALRYVAAVALAVALLFGSVWRIGTVTEIAGGARAEALASGPVWEGWIEPPAYTGLPTLYLADQSADRIEVPQGARVILRFYGRVGDLALSETVSAGAGDRPAATDPEQEFTVTQSGNIGIDGRGGRDWQIVMRPDQPPTLSITGPAETTFDGQMTLPFRGQDDYGIVAGKATITLDLSAVSRRHGLATAPEPRAAITLDLPMPVSRDRADFTESLIENFSEHPWAHLPVLITLQAEDAAGLTGQSQPQAMSLPARRFFDPLAAALIEQRRDLLWTVENGTRAAMILRTLAHRPEEKLFKRETDYLRLRTIIRQLEMNIAYGLDPDQRDEIASALWDLALQLEEGDLDNARERMNQAKERLEQAMKNGASEQEIARLMQDLRDATRDYLRQLAQQSQRDADQARQQGDFDPENSVTMTQDDLQRMMDRIQELMEQGRMAEAQQALEELQQLLENMQMSQSGQGQGQGQQSPGQQAMEGLAETLRDQQGLSDQAFRDLQDQFNPGSNRGQQRGQQGQQGQDPGEGQGEEGEGEGQGQQQGEGEGQQPGAGQGEQSLADRQRALRDELQRQRGRLPGVGGEAGEAARDALDRADRAMDQAEGALREGDLPGAIDRQSEAMEALRDGIRNLGQAMAEEQGQQQGGENQQMSDAQGQRRDPLGRNPGSRGGSIDSGDEMLGGDDVNRRARELLDEIRRRSGETARPETERDYLRRLLDRF